MRKEFMGNYQLEAEADELIESIIKQFGKYGVNIGICDWRWKNGRFVFRIKLKGNTREAHIRAHASDVQLPIFYIDKHEFILYIVVSREKPKYQHLLHALRSKAYCQTLRQKTLPYLVGHDAFGERVIVDLAQSPHLLLGGSSGSGKSVGLQSLIACMAFVKQPFEVNFILIDVGAGDLIPFDGIPHLSCPVVRDQYTAFEVLKALKTEMERRVKLEHDAPNDFDKLPMLVLVIDEFPALFMGMVDKSMSRLLLDIISSLLQRGRHAKIHMVLAAQNPTFQYMRVDLGNITSRIAFKCAKKNYSETILDESGAEKLLEPGSMLMKSAQHDGLLQIQGMYSTPDELQLIVGLIKKKSLYNQANKFNFVITDQNSPLSSDVTQTQLMCSAVIGRPLEADRQLAEVIMWALNHKSASINMLMKEKRFGWNKASKLVDRLVELGIVDNPDGKLPREVLIQFPDDLSEELMKFLKNIGYSQDDVLGAIHGR